MSLLRPIEASSTLPALEQGILGLDNARDERASELGKLGMGSAKIHLRADQRNKKMEVTPAGSKILFSQAWSVTFPFRKCSQGFQDDDLQLVLPSPNDQAIRTG